MTSGRICNGPYLLSPGPRQMTVAWETAASGCFRVVCTAPDGRVCRQEAMENRELSCPEHPEGALIYTADFADLLPGTEYRYEIYTGDELCASASFQTLTEQPEKLHLMTLSDSHLFHAAEAFQRAAERIQPDYLLHTGDISFGTGYQHDQYPDNWFRKIPELLARLPVIYAHGNHDDGPFFDAFISKPQMKGLSGMKSGEAFSFDDGMAHFTFVDSNPWALLEMNGVNAGIAADARLRARIEAILAWAEEDLMGEPARRAAWRILVAHHPYTDAFNNRYLIPVAERCGVDLVLGGHLHYYIKAISAQPNIGARTMYICQGSAQDPAADYEGADGTHRLLTEFPEVAATGNNNYGVLDITADAIDYRLCGFLADGTEKEIDAVHMTKDVPRICFRNVTVQTIDADGQIEVCGVAENAGTGVASVALPLVDNGEEHLLNLFGKGADTQVILLNPGETRAFAAYYRAEGVGAHRICVAGVTHTLETRMPEAFSYEHLFLRIGTGENVDCLFASAEVTNHLDRAADIEISLMVDGTSTAVQHFSFAAHERRSVTFCHRFERAGTYWVGIADLPPKEVTIEGAVRIVPRIHDKSGKSHTVLLHGTPKVFERNGQMEVELAEYGDYIEILPRTDLATPHGLTGIVTANMYRFARADEMGHSPLMIRGKSIGWGAGYALRMAVERNGAIKWGICHGVEEYFWQGGSAEVDVWHQYAMTFDKARGGASFIDGEQRGCIGGIDPSSELRQWADQPIFVGYSYIGHVIPELGKPKYFTHLPANVAQVRFYTEGLTEEEMRAVYENPDALGPRSDALGVWLDFRRIESTGTHTTEWRHPAVYAPAYLAEKIRWTFQTFEAEVHIPAHTAIRSVVEVSDDGVSIKDRKEIALQDGRNSVDLTELAPAQYLRIETKLQGEVGAAGTFVPELCSYEVSAAYGTLRANLVWSTRAQWERGTFTGATDFPPVDRLRDYPEYTDIIHG